MRHLFEANKVQILLDLVNVIQIRVCSWPGVFMIRLGPNIQVTWSGSGDDMTRTSCSDLMGTSGPYRLISADLTWISNCFARFAVC